MKRILPLLSCWALALIVSSAATWARADDAQDHQLSLAGGKLRLTVPDSWQKKKPANNVIEYEFAVPAAEGDENPGRVTVTGAGGSVEANLERWIGQFKQPDGSNTKDRAKVKQDKVAGQEVHLLDVAGTFDDRPPFAGGGVERKGYRMLAAIVTTKDLGNYFIKFYGPAKTVADNEQAFGKLISSLERK